MKPTILRTFFFITVLFLLTSMTSSTTIIVKSKKQKDFNEFFAKRSLIMSSINELEIRYNTKFNFIQKLKIKQAKKKISKELQKVNLLAECDTIKLKSGEEIIAVVNEIGVGEIKYKKCDNKTGPTYSIKKSDIASIRYANGSMDYFGNENTAGINKNDEVNSAEAKTDPLAIVSVIAPVAGIIVAILASSVLAGMLVVGVGVVLGFVSINNIKKSKGKLKGSGIAKTGIIIGLVLTAFYFIYLAAKAASN